MARKVKEEKLDLYYLGTEDKKEGRKTRAKKNSPSKHTKKRGTKEESDSDVFNFDNEIVIGINVLPDKKKKNTNKKSTISKNIETKKEKKVSNKVDKTKNKTSNSSKPKAKTSEKAGTKAKTRTTTKQTRKPSTKSNVANKKKNKVQEDKKDTDNDRFDFDEEIVIGVNVLPNSKVKKENQKNKSSKNKIRQNKNNLNRNSMVEDEDKHTENYMKTKRIVRSFIIIFLFIGVAVLFMISPIFSIEKINVSGNLKISNEQIISLSQIQLGTNTYKMINSQIEDNIKENAYIDTVNVKRKLPNEINIIVTERKPQYMLKYGNAFVYLNNQGYLLEISEEKLQLPIISGYTTLEENLKEGNRLNQEDLKKLETVLKIMESATNNDISTYISEINIADSNNFTLILESKGKTAYLGDATSINDRIIILRQMIIKAEGKSGQAFLIDKDRMYFREE